MDERPSNDRRAHFRLRYPQVEQPRIRIGKNEFFVSEISEGGARIVADKLAKSGQSVSGEIQFQDGELVPIESIVLRHSESETVLKFTKGISPMRIAKEQIRLSKRYPSLFSKPDGE